MMMASDVTTDHCFQLLSQLRSEEQLQLMLSILDATPDNHLAAFLSPIFLNIYARHTGNSNCKLPSDCLENIMEAMAVLEKRQITNVVYFLAKSIAEHGSSTKHLFTDSLSFCVIELITTSLISVDLANNFHEKDRSTVFLQWLIEICETAKDIKVFVDEINKLLFASEEHKYIIEKDEETNTNKIVFANIVNDDSVEENKYEENDILEEDNWTSDMTEKISDLDGIKVEKEDDNDDDNNESFNNLYEEEIASSNDDDDYAEPCKKKIKLSNKKTSSKQTITKYSCTVCKKLYFSTKPSLIDHMVKNHCENEKGKYQCYLCKEKEKSVLFDSLEEMEKHLFVHDRMCCICDYVIPEFQTMKYHRHKHTTEQGLSCQYCKQQFSSRWEVHTHIFWNHSDIRPFGCQECMLRYASANALQEHCDVKHKKLTKRNACSLCDRRFDYKCALANHMREVHIERQEKKYQCDLCSKPFQHELSLQYHRKKAHNVDIKINHECLHCDKKFQSKHQLIRHKISQHPRAPSIFKCPICTERFSSRKMMKDHYSESHEINTYGDLKCEKCEKTFPDEKQLKQHNDLMHSDKEFMCHLCSEVFKTKTGLDSHVNQHSGKKQYLCDVCGKGFSTQRNCDNHKMHLHDKTMDERRAAYAKKSVTCEECGKRFGCQRNLTIHIERVHKGNKLYATHQCHLCGGYFSAKIALQKHIETQHDGIKRPTVSAKCDLCPKSFSSMPTLKWHKQQVHSVGCTPYQCNICRNYYNSEAALKSHLAKNKHANRQPGRNKVRKTDMYPDINIEQGLKEHQVIHAENMETSDIPTEIQWEAIEENNVTGGNSIMIEETGETIELPPGTKFIQLGDQILELVNN